MNVRQAPCRDAGLTVRQCLLWDCEQSTALLPQDGYTSVHKVGLYGWTDGSPHLWTSNRRQTTVLTYEAPADGESLSVPLNSYCMENNTRGMDAVLDPWCGSGTTTDCGGAERAHRLRRLPGSARRGNSRPVCPPDAGFVPCEVRRMRINIEYRRLNSLRPYENNPRDNEAAISGVAASIRRFGFRSPILIDRDGVIVCGHTRYLAAQSLGLTEVPCVQLSDLTEETGEGVPPCGQQGCGEGHMGRGLAVRGAVRH